MIWFFTLIGLLFAGSIGFLAQYGPGRWIITYQDWIIEFPLWLGILLNLFVVIAILLLNHLCRKINQAFGAFLGLFGHFRQDRLRQQQQDLSQFLDTLANLAKQNDIEAVKKHWHNGSRRLRFHPESLLMYATALKNSGQQPMAENILRQAIGRDWYDSWVRLYGLVSGENAADQLKTAEKWLKKHPLNAVLLLTLGRLSLQNQLWGKAKDYLERSLQIHPSAEAFAELGQLHESLGDLKSGEWCYKQGLLAEVELTPQRTTSRTTGALQISKRMP